MRLKVCKVEDVATKKWSQNMLVTTANDFGVKFETFIVQHRLMTACVNTNYLRLMTYLFSTSRTILVRLAMQGFARCYYLISKRKQHAFRTFGQIRKLQGKQ